MSETPTSHRVTDRTGMTTVLARSAPNGSFAARMGVPLGRAISDDDTVTLPGVPDSLVVHAVPDTWTVLAPSTPAGQVMRRLERLGAGEFTSVVDLTPGYAYFRLAGATARSMLETLCAVDLSDAAKPHGAAFRSLVARITVTIVRDDEDGVASYLLQCDRSYRQYLHAALRPYRPAHQQ